MLKLFELAGYKDYKRLETNKFYPVNKNIKIASFKENKKVFKTVKSVVYKGECKDGFLVEVAKKSFKATPQHKLYDAVSCEFKSLKDIWNNNTKNFLIFKGLNEKGETVDVRISKTLEEFPVLDLEVEDTHSYFSQGILSHNTFGSSAKILGMVIKRMNYFVDRYCTPVIWISQERSNMSPVSHLNSLTGGMSTNFYPSTRFRVSAKEPLTKNGEIVGLKIKIKNYKNKTGIPNRECFLDIYFKDGDGFKKGIDGEGQYLDMLLELGLINQHGAWYYYRENDPDETKRIKMQGWGGVQNWFKENPKEFEEVKKLVDDKMSGFDETLDKRSVEVSEADEIKKEVEETEKRKSENTEKLAEKALADEGAEE